MKTLKFQYLLIITITAFTILSCGDDDCTPDTNIDLSTSNISTNSDSTTYSIYSDIVINASPEKVWTVLTDWDNMENWSSSFIGLTGDIRDGGQVVARFNLDGDILEFPHTLRYVKEREFGWSDPLIFAPEITDNHSYEVQAISDCQTRFIQTDEYTGQNPMFPLSVLATQTEAVYNQFNTELKTEVEK